MTVQDTVSDLIGGASVVQAYATTVQMTDSETVTAAQAAQLAAIRTAVGSSNFTFGGNMLLVRDVAANIADPANAAGIALATSVSLSADSVATVAQVSQLAALGGRFSASASITLIDTAAALISLAGNATLVTAVNGWNSQALLSADATTNVAGVKQLLSLGSFSAGTHKLTVSDTVANLLNVANATALSAATAVHLSQADATTVAGAAVLAALHGFLPTLALTIADTPAHLAALSSSLAALASAETLVSQTVSNTTEFVISAGQLNTLLALHSLTAAGFSGTITVADTVANLTGLASAFTGIPSGSLLSHVATGLSENVVTSALNASQLAGLPGFSPRGHTLAIQDAPDALLSPSANAGIAIAGSVGLSAPVTISVAVANALTALHNFAADNNALTIADTPVNLAAMSPSVAIFATAVQVTPWMASDANAYTLDVAGFTALASLSHLSFDGFSGAIIVQDTAAHLVALTEAMAGASPGSILLLMRGIMQPELTSDAAVSVSDLNALASLINLNLNGHNLVVTSTPSALLGAFVAGVPLASSVILAPSTHPWVVSAADAEHLATMPGFSPGSAGMTIVDTAGAILADPNAAGLAAADGVLLSADATVSAADAMALHALPGFSRDGHALIISDTRAHIAALDPGTTAMATGIVYVGSAPSILSVSEFNGLIAQGGTGGGLVTVSDSAVELLTLVGTDLSQVGSAIMNAPAELSADQAQALTTLPNFTAGSGLTISDTVANLLRTTGSSTFADDATGEMLASSVSLSDDATVTADQAAMLSQLGFRFSNGGHALIVQDTPTALMSFAGWGAIADQVTGTRLSPNGSPWMVSAAAAVKLANLPNFDAGPGMAVVDNISNLLASTNANGLAHAGSVTVNGDVSTTAANAMSLHAIANFTIGTNHLTISDGAGRLAALDAGTAAMATAIQMSGDGIISASQFQTLRTLPNFSTNGKFLTVADSASNLLALAGGDTSLASMLVLSSNATLTADQAETLAALPIFSVGLARLTIQDTVAHLLHVTGTGNQPDDWAGEIAASTIALTQNAVVTAAQATELAVLGARISLGGHALTVSDSAANLLDSANAMGLLHATAVTLSGAEGALSAAAATRLAAITNFSKGSASITVSDTASNLVFGGNAAGVAIADHIQLNTATTLAVHDAEALVGLASFQISSAAPLSIADTLPNLLSLATADLTNYQSLLDGLAITLSANTTATVAQVAALESLPQYGGFSLGGHTLTVVDTGVHLAGFMPDGIADPTGYAMAGDATLTTEQADALAALGVDLDGNVLTIADVPAALLDSAHASGLALATHLTLYADATVDAATATALAVDSRFNPGTHSLTVQDTAEALLGLGAAVAHLADGLELIASQDVSVTTLLGLTRLGSRFSLAGSELTVVDTASHLATLNDLETSLVSGEVLNADATVGAATATALAALDAFARGGHTLTVSDSAAALLSSAYAAGIGLADHEQLSAPTTVSVSGAQALLSLPNFQTSSAAPLAITDTLPHLLGLATVTLSTNGNLLLNMPIGLSVDTVATVAQMVALAGLPEYAGFSLNGHTLTVMDSGRHLAGFIPDGTATPTAYVMVGDATLTATQADELAALGVDLGDNNVTVADTPDALLDASHAVGLAIAATIVLSGNATVDAEQAVALHAISDFTTGGHLVTIQDTAEALLGLDGPIQQMASALALSGSETIGAAMLLGLTRLGTKFDLAGNTLIVAGTATELAGLNTLETDLTAGQVLTGSANVTAAAMEKLAELPNPTLGNGVDLVVQDSVAHLTGLSDAALALATEERLLPGSHVELTAAQAAGLAALGHFSSFGATIIVNDTVAHLESMVTDGWRDVATGYVVTDTVGHLAGASAGALLTDASAVTLIADSETDAATAAILAGLNTFTTGGSALVVTDGPAEIAAHVAAILAVATEAQVNATVPILAVQAEALASLATAGILSLSTGVHILVEDSFASLSDGAAADGLLLASQVTVLDNASNLIAASAHAWGSISPHYALSEAGVISGSDAIILAAIGSHFSLNGQSLLVEDTAAGVAGAGSALLALGISGDVTDSVVEVVAHTAGLLALGNRLVGVNLTDSSNVGAADAAALHGLALVLSGAPLTVTDTAAAVSANLLGLEALGVHLGAVIVTDTAADVAAVTSGALAIQGLAGKLSVVLTDSAPVAADVAANLAPVLTNLAAQTVIGVFDTGVAIVAHASALESLGSVLGIITLSDGTTVTAAVAAGLLPLETHLDLGVTLSVSDTAAQIVTNAAALTSLQADGRIAGIEAAHDTVAHIIASGTVLAELGATATIIDSATHVATALDSLETITQTGLLLGIVLNDGGTPALGVTLSQLSTDGDALGLIGSSFSLTVTNTAAEIEADLASGISVLLAHLGSIGSIVANDAGGLALSASVALSAGVDDGAGSVLALFQGGGLTVTEATAADIAYLAALFVTPASIAVDDTAAGIQADLESGASQLMANRALISGITVNDGGIITLTAVEALSAHVDDGVGSIFGLLSGGTLEVSSALVSDLEALAALPIVPAHVSLSDSAAAIEADLAAGAGSHILAHLGLVAGIVVNGGGTVTLTETQALAAGVDDGGGSALYLMTGGAFVVSDALAADVGLLAGLGVPPSAITVNDTAAGIQADLTSGGSQLLVESSLVSAIVVSDGGTISLSASLALSAGIDDGSGSVIAKLSGGTFAVTDVPVSELAAVAGLDIPPASIAVSDTAADIQADLVSGASSILIHLAGISGIAVNDAGTITLTSAQVMTTGVDDGAGSVLARMTDGNLAVTDVAVADIGTVAGLTVSPASMTVSDTAAAVQADLTSGTSAILAQASLIGSITLTDATTPDITLTVADLASDANALALIVSSWVLRISDTATHIQADLVAGSSHILAHLGGIGSIEVSDAGTISLTAAQISAAGVDDGAGSALDKLSGGSLTVTGVSVADIGTILGLGVAPARIEVSDTAAAVAADLASGGSSILAHLSAITAIAVGDAGTIELPAATALAAGVDDGAGSALSKMTGGTLAVTGAAVADIASLLALPVAPQAIAISDTAAHIRADLIAGGSSHILSDLAGISGITVGDSGTISLTAAQVQASGVDDGAGSALSKLSGGNVIVTGAAVADIGTLLGLGVVPASIAVSDTAAHIQADLIAGSSQILGHLAAISGIAVSPAGTITLTSAQIQAAGVDDGIGSAVAKMTGETLVVTGVAVTAIGTVLGLGVTPSHIAVADTAAHVQADLIAGGSSHILSHLAAISGITVNPVGTITLTSTQAQAAGVDDGAGSALSKMSGETLVVTGVAVADIATILALGVPPSSITVSDTAAHIQADLIAGGWSNILAELASITAIAVNDAGTITLTTSQALAASVDDGSGSAIAKLSGGHFAVSGVAVSNVNTIASLPVAPASIAVSDTAAHLQADLTGGASKLLAQRVLISAITVNDAGTISLTEAQVTAAHVDDGAGSVLSRMTGGSLTVTGVVAADIGVIAALGVAPTHIAVSDTAAHIQADLTGGSSNLLAQRALISAIAVGDAGTISLTAAQVIAAHVDDGAGSVLSKLSGGTLVVTGVAVADIASILALGVAPSSIAVSDTAAHIQADLIVGGSSHILSNLAAITGIAVSDAGTITLTSAQAQAAGVDDGTGSAIAKLSGSHFVVTGVAAADINTITALPVVPYSIAVSDTAAHIQADLVGGGSKLLAQRALISGIAVSDAGTISLTEAQATAVHVDDGAGSVMSKLAGGALVVTGVTVADIATILTLGVAPSSITVSDTAAHIQADLRAGGASEILPNLATISTITASPVGTISLTSAQAQAAGMDDGAGSALAKMTGETLVVTGVAVADIGTVLGLGVAPASISVSDTAAHIQTDLIAGGSSHILSNLAAISAIAVSPAGTITLTSAQAQAVGVDDGGGSALAKMTGETLVVSGVAVADIGEVLALGVAPGHITVSDTAAHIQADLAAGGVSEILTNLAAISAVTVSPTGPITLTSAQAQAAGVDDGAGSALAKLSGGSVTVTDVLVADIDTILGLGVEPNHITVSDTAAHIQADLRAGGASEILPNLATISTITVSPAGTISLTSAQAQAAGMDDGAGSALAKMTGETLVVTGVAVADIGTVLGLGVAPASISVSDTAAHIQTDLIAGGSSHILGNLAAITGIAVSPAGTITLTSAQAQAVGVNDGGGSALAKMTGETLVVSGVAVADIGAVLALGVAPGHITVSDTAAHLQANLATGGSSAILANLGVISAIAVSDAGTITLTNAQAQVAGVDDGAGSALSKITGGHFIVSGVDVASINAIAGLPVAPDGFAVSDTAAHLQADLAGGASKLLAQRGLISTIAVSDAGTISLTEGQVTVAHVDDGAGSVFSKVTGGSLTVTGVLAADAGTIAGLAVPPAHIAVSDTAAHIQADLTGGSSQLLAERTVISGIAVSDAGTISLTSAQVTATHVDDGAGSVLSKLGGGTLEVTGVSVADIPTILALGVPPSSITVSDTAAHIQADLIAGGSSNILGSIGDITVITVSDAGTITLTSAQVQAAGVDDGIGSALSMISGGHLAVTGVDIASIDTILGLDVVPDSIAVSDTSAHLQSDLTGGESKLLADRSIISAINVNDAGTISLTQAQVTAAHVDDGAGSVLSRLSGGSLTVTSVLAADVGTVAGLGVAPTHIAVSDTAADIQADLTGGTSHLLAQRALVSAIAVSDAGTISLTAAQVVAAHVDDGAGSVLSKLSGGTLVVTGVSVANIDTILALGVAPSSITVSDTAAHIQADLIAGGSSHILGNLASITGIAVNPAGIITLTSAQVRAANVDDGGGSALAKMTGETLVVAGVAVADIGTILALGVAPGAITVSDSAANVLVDLGGAAVIVANGAAITTVKPTDASLSVATATSLYDGLNGVTGFDESTLTITGTAAALLSAHGSVPGMLSAAQHVTMSNNPTGLTAAQATTLSGILGGVLGGGQTVQVVDTTTHLLDSANVAGIALATDVELDTGTVTSASVATVLANLHGFNAGAQSIWVQDTVAYLLDPANAAGIAAASRVTPQADSTVTAAQLTSLAALNAYDDGGHSMTAQDTAAHIVALSQPALDFAALVSVHDTSAYVATNLAALQSVVTAHSHAMEIVLSDGALNTPSITVDATTYIADAATLDTITTAGTVKVVDTAAALAAIAALLHNDTIVGEVDVSDTAANILSNLTALNTIGAKFLQATISDTTINAAEVAALLAVPHLSASSLTISDTGSLIAAAIAANGAPGITFMNNHTVQLSTDSVVTASEALALESLSSLSKNSHTLKAWDTAAHLTDSIDGYLAAVSAGIIDGVYLKTSGGTATVSASSAALLFSIPGFSKNNPNGSSNVLTVQDTAAHIESAFTALNAHHASIDHIVVSASTTVTDAVYGHLLTLGATGAMGVSLTVRDTAASIIAGAPSQLAGSPSMTPTMWALSGSATVTAAGAAYLGGLAGFNAGAYSLTLATSATGVSVSDANAIGALGGTFRLNGYHVGVTGSVATVSGLSNAAKAIVTPDIVDTFVHLAAVDPSSGLLTGTFTVTDSSTVTVAQATSFLALIGGGGIPAANVSFGGHVEAVTDTLNHIQSLTGSGGWSSNASLHADFHLVVADTVATLINGANTAMLAGMSGTTFSADQTTSAVNAETLYGLEGTIHFSKGSYTLTIQDTAAHLLDPANMDGEALADTWLLSGSDMASAADAETLLSQSKFHLNHTLTVSDSSDNLLDGILAGIINASAYKASVQVELAGAEVLDAQTAEALVSLPGFTDTGDLSIQDSSPYLLNAANHDGEVAASTVTLMGDETVSVSIAARLAALPHFTLDSSHLYLASNDYADAATLTAIADFGAGFDANGNSLTMTQNALSLTPAEYTALLSDNVVLNGHALSALATGISVTSGAGTVHVAASGVEGATLNVYASDGTSLSHASGVAASFTADASEGAIGNAVVVTETVGVSAATSESAPIIAIERTVLTSAATAASATFAGSGQVQVDVGKYVDVYTTANVPAHPASPVLVYDATAHTLSLDIDGQAPLVLVTLGTATHPASLDPAEIFVRHFA